MKSHPLIRTTSHFLYGIVIEDLSLDFSICIMILSYSSRDLKLYITLHFNTQNITSACNKISVVTGAVLRVGVNGYEGKLFINTHTLLY